MIYYYYEEEKITALLFADLFHDALSKRIILDGCVLNEDEAIHLSRFFWRMVNRSAEGGVELPCEGGSQYWLEKLYNSFGGYLINAGYEKQWNDEIDNA